MIKKQILLFTFFFILLAGPYLLYAELVEPNSSTLNQVKQKRVLVIDDKLWNQYHEVPKEETLIILETINTKIGFDSFTVRDTAETITAEDLNNYDIVIFNYCDNLYNAVGTPFESALKQWFATGNKGYMGYHTSGFYFTPPSEIDEWWTWYNDNVTSIRPDGNTKLNSGAHTQGSLIKTSDDSIAQAPIFDGLDAKFTIGDVWLTLATEAPAAAPTWPDCKVLYYHEADMMPQIWIREDGLGNRYFYSMQFHDTEDGVHSDFWHNLLMRAIEYIGGEREVQPTPLPTITPTPGTGLKGDVDDDAEVTIVDALLIAQKYVGIPLGIFLTENADVNCDNEIDIIDALLVAQLYVGLIASFPC